MAQCRYLYQLEEIDLELERGQEELERIRTLLAGNASLDELRGTVAAFRERLRELRSQEKEAEWELQDLGAKIARVNDALYSGKSRNPRELANQEKGLDMLKSQLEDKEAGFLELVSEADKAEASMAEAAQKLEDAESEWRKEEEALRHREVELATQFSAGQQRRGRLASEIAPDALRIYDAVKQKRRQAVVKVEGGRCQGCRLVLPTKEWQEVKTGALVLCSSCGRILCLN